MNLLVWLFSNGVLVIEVILAFTVIVFIHELGHYLVARWNGIAIQTFSLGFGPEVAGFNDRHGTRWRLSMIPLGGYVRFVGDMNAASVPDEEFIASVGPELHDQLFVNKNVWRRIAVVVAGPVANIILTFVVLYGLIIGYGRYTIPPVIDHVQLWSPAMAAGLLDGDRVTAVDGFRVRSFDDFQRLIETAPERTVTLELERAGESHTIRLVPQVATETDRFGGTHRIGRIGVTKSIDPADIVLYRPNPIEAVGDTVDEIHFIVDRTVAFLGDFFVGRGDVKQLGGPVKIAQISYQMATLGLPQLISLVAYLSLNIGVFNLLPIPMLDGGHLAYFLVEAARGRPLSRRAQEIGYRFGLALVFSLMIFTFINDLF